MAAAGVAAARIARNRADRDRVEDRRSKGPAGSTAAAAGRVAATEPAEEADTRE